MNKNLQTIIGFAICLSFVSFAPNSLLTQGRAPASDGQPKKIIQVKKTRQQLFVFGPLIIYKRSEHIDQVRIEYRRLQADVDKIAAQKTKIEKLIAEGDISMKEVARLKSQLKDLNADQEQTKNELESLKNEFDAERVAMQADIDALKASNDATEAQKKEALAKLEEQQATALALSGDIDGLKKELEKAHKELADAKEQLEDAQAQLIAKEEELSRIKCENADSLASLKKDIKKIERERNDLNEMMTSMQEDYEAQLAQQQMQSQMMMMAMAQFSYQSMQFPQPNPYLMQSSLFDTNALMMHIQQAQQLNQMYRQQYTPQMTNNFYGNYSNVYGSGDFRTQASTTQNDQYSMFANSPQNINSSRMPSSVQPSLAPGYFVF